MIYLKRHKRSGLKVGDNVIVIRKAELHEQGWTDSWNMNMTRLIGKEGKITDDSDSGFTVSFGMECWNFPYFVLNNRKDKIKKILE